MAKPAPKKPAPKPKAPKQSQQQRDLAAIFSAANAQAAASYRDQLSAQIAAYPQLEGLQMGTVGKVAANLDNSFTQRAAAQADFAAGQSGRLNAQGDLINTQAASANQLGQSAAQFAQGPTAMDNRIARLGMNAMRQRADQVSMPGQIRNVSALNAAAAQIAPIDQVSSRDVAAARMDAAPEVRALNARAAMTDFGGLGDQLLSSAQARLANNGQLSEEELRNASQSARGAFSARGLGVGSGAAAAEILNRASASRQRLNEDSAFAANVQAQDLSRRQQNTSNLNQFRLANQGVGMQAQLANQQVGYNTNLQNAQLAQQANLANQDSALRAALANQGTSLSLGQANAGFAQQAALANQQVGMQAQIANQSADQTMNAQTMQAQMANQGANQQQTAQNRAFMLDANNAFNNSQISRGGYAANMLGQTANLYGQAGGAFQNAANIGLGASSAYLNADPYQRALSPGGSFAQGNMGTSGQMIGNTYQQALDTSGNMYTFRINQADSNRNAQLNNQAALAGAQTASNGAMLGAGIGAVGMIGAGALVF